MSEKQKRMLALIVVLAALALLVVLGGATVAALASEAIITVCPPPGAGCDYTTIQEAVDNADSGDTIRVAQGTYTENLTIDGKTLTLRGGYTISDTEWLTDTGETVIDGNGADRTFLVHGNNSALENLTITGGHTPAGQCWGGGVWVTNGNVTIRDSLITGNWADCSGAGVEVNSDWGPAHLTLADSIVFDNQSGGDCGGISVWHTGAHLTNTLIISNTGGNGSALRIEDSDVTIQNCTVADNQGSAAINAYDTDGQPDALALRNTIAWGNTDSNLACNVQVCTVTYSDVGGDWSGVDNINADPQFADPSNGDYHLLPWSPCIDEGTATDAPDHDLDGVSRPQNAGYDLGAYEFVGTPIQNEGTRYVAISGSNAGPNLCLDPDAPCATVGHAVSMANAGESLWIAEGTYTENLTIDGKTLTLRGGYTISGTEWLTDTGETVIDGNGADRTFLIHGNDSALENLTITGGQAPSAQCWGGGVWVTNGNVTIRSSTITGNAGDCGGAGIEVNDDFGLAHLTLESSTVSYNTDGQVGGGLHVWGENASAQVQDVTFAGNTAGESGGGMAVANYASATIADTHLFSNTADHGGGGIMVDSFAQAQITNVVAEHNNGSNGGGIAVREGASAVIRGTRIISNTANGAGGGIGMWGAVPVVVMADTIISDNYGYHAGGVWCELGDCTATNLLVVDNHSGPGPAGISLLASGGGQLMNVTVSGNDSATGIDGAEIGGLASGFPIVNSIFWGNYGANLAGSNLDVRYSDVQGGFAGTGNIDANPEFVDPASGDYHLQGNSPAIDTGTPAGAPPADLDGTPRDAEPDMGAYEWTWFRIYLPLVVRNQ
jgi:hypothetical protein